MATTVRFVRTRLSQSANAHADSEAVAQEVLCRAYTGFSRFHGEELVETWLQRIARYAIINAARAAGRERRLSEGTGMLDRVREVLTAGFNCAKRISPIHQWWIVAICSTAAATWEMKRRCGKNSLDISRP